MVGGGWKYFFICFVRKSNITCFWAKSFGLTEMHLNNFSSHLIFFFTDMSAKMFCICRLNLHSKCGPNLIFFFAHMWLRSVFLMTVWTAQTTGKTIFSIPIFATSICDTKSDTGQMFCNATTVNSHIGIHATFVTIQRSWETLKRFYIPKVIKTVAKSNQWKYSDVSELLLTYLSSEILGIKKSRVSHS